MREYYTFHPIGLYTLMEFGVSLRNVSLLIDEGIVLNDIVHHTEKFVTLGQNKYALSQKLMDIIDEITEQLFAETNYKLIAEGLSIHNVELLNEMNLTYSELHSLSYEQFSELIGGQTKKAVYERIMEAYEKTDDVIQNMPKTSPYSFFIESCFEQLEPRVFIDFAYIKQYIRDELNIPLADVDETAINYCLDELISSQVIYQKDHTFAKKYITLNEFLQKDFKDRDFFLQRLHNKTLQEIAENQDLSRERVRQKIKSVIKKMPIIEEQLVYQQIFETYDWEEELFCEVFNEQAEVYYFLNLIHTKGTTHLLDKIDYLPLSNKQKQIILTYYNYFINFDGEPISLSNKLAFFEHLVFYLGQQAVTDTAFIHAANQYIQKHQLSEQLLFDERNTIGLADRSNNILRTKSNGFRYYDLTSLNKDDINKLKELMKLEPGIYSTRKLYKENLELMSELTINSAYELHNLYKKLIDLPHIEYTRMPEFSVGGLSKSDFLTDLCYELAPISLDDFLDYADEHFGLKRSSLRSLIQSNFSQYVHENMITVDYPTVTKDELATLKQFLTDDIYSIEPLVKIGKKWDPNFKRKYINKHTLSKVGYFLRGNFVLHDRYQSIEQYFYGQIIEHDIFVNPRTEIYQTTSFRGVLYSMERSLDVIRVATDTYYTQKKLQSEGITIDDLIDFRDTAYQYAKKYTFFTLFQLRGEGFSHPLDEHKYPEMFYERVIWTHPELKAIHTASHIIFHTHPEEVMLKNFLEFTMQGQSKVKLADFNQFLYDQYGLEFQAYKLVEFIKNSKLHYTSATKEITGASKPF